jgi:phosphinothricin acetyltransferase
MQILHANANDAARLQALRNHYVINSNATFDETPLSLEAVQAWIASFPNRGAHHLLVACLGEALLGFCSSQPYRSHPAFASTVETSVYVAADAARQGVGTALYAQLFGLLGTAGLHRAVVGIALPNPASIALHERFEFRAVGVFTEYASKHGQFISSQWMERVL